MALFGLSVPNFWLGLMAMLLFAIAYPILPASGFVSVFDDPVQSFRHLLMPALVLGSGLAAVIMRQTRSAMIEALRHRLRPHRPGQGPRRARRWCSGTRCATASSW